jgi:HK97 family phage portal protein
MSWITKSSDWIREKLNPAQTRIAQDAGTQIGTDAKITYYQSFQKLESVNRSVSMLVSAASSLDYDIKDKVHDGIVTGIRQKTLNTLLNFRPNPYQSAQDFRTALFTDFILEGNAFIHFDGVFMYHLPASKVEILTDEKTFIKGFRYNGFVDFKESEVFYFRDLSSDSIYRGSSRLQSADRSIGLLYSMQKFQENFFDNGAVFGLVLTTDNTLSQVAKEKTIAYWLQKYNVKNGGKRPVILDSGLKPHQLAETNFRDMDFDTSIKTHGEKIMQAVGVPPILLQGGNNANISPNLRLFYLETVLPINRKFISAVERYFGYDVEAITSSVSALQPELKDIAAYHSTLVNGGIISPNEARQELRYEPKPGNDDLRIPANIAGSAANPSTGGRPASAKE